MELNQEQRKRVNKCRTQLNRFWLDGTLAHCKKMYKSGMPYEACEILMDHTGKSYMDCLAQIQESIKEDEKLI